MKQKFDLKRFYVKFFRVILIFCALILSDQIISAAQLDHFNISAPTFSTADSVFYITVTAIANDGSVFTSYTGTVIFTTSSGLAVLPDGGTYTFQTSDAGVVVLPVQLMSGGDQSLTVTDSQNDQVGTTVVTITGGSAASLTISAPASASAGQAFYITVIAKDLYNNVSLSYSGTVHFTSTDSTAVLPPDATFQRDDNGQEILAVTTKTEGTQTISGQDLQNSSISGVSNAIAVSSGIIVNFSVSAPTIANPGTNFNFAVSAMDAYGNVAENYTGTVHFTSSDGAAVLPANYTFQSSDYGSRIFPVTLNTVGSQTITASDASAATITGISNNIDVLASGSTLYSQPLLLTSYLTTANAYQFVYIYISNPASTAIPANSYLQYDVFMPSYNPDFYTGTEFAETVGPAAGQWDMRDFGQATQSYIIDQNGIRCHPSMDLSAYADGQWYQRTFNIGSLVGYNYNQAELAQDTGNAGQNGAPSNKAGTFNAVFDNIVFTNSSGSVIKNFYSDNNTIPFNGGASINGTTAANEGSGGISTAPDAIPLNNYIWIVKSLSVTQTPIGDVQVGGQYVTIAAQLLSVGNTRVAYALVDCTSNRFQDSITPILATTYTADTLAITNAQGYAYNLISSTAAGPAVVTVRSAHLLSMITINFVAGPATQVDIIPNTLTTQTNVSGSMKVEVQDAYGNLTVSTQTVNISANALSNLRFSGDNGATWHQTLAVSGAASSNILVMDSAAETSTVYAAAAGLSTGTATVYVNNAQVAALVINPATSTTQAGVGSLFTIQAKDANNNDAYSTASVQLVSASGTMMFSTDNTNYSSTLSVILNDGSASVYYRDTSMSAMPVTVTASSTGLTSGKAYETIVPNSAAILNAWSNYSAVPAGQWVTITAEITDAYGNPILGQWVTATALPQPGTTITASTNTTNASGEITIYFKTDTTADNENYCIVNSPGLLGKTVTISGSGAATHLSILPSPYSIGAGTTGLLYINAKDVDDYNADAPTGHTSELIYLPAGDAGNAFDFSIDGINWVTSTVVQLNTSGAGQVYVKSTVTGSYIADVIDEDTTGQLTAANDTITVTTGYYVYVSPSTPLTTTAGTYVTITAWIVNQSGTPQALQNVQVTFNTSNGSVSPVIAYTNVSGQASTILTTAIAPYAQQIVYVTTSNPNANTVTAVITSMPVITFDVSLPATSTKGTVVQAVVRARDAYGVTVPNYTGTVNFTSTDTSAVMPASYTFQASDAGVKSFNVTFNAAGTWTLTATDSVKSSIAGTSNNIIVYLQPTPTPTNSPTKTITYTKTPSPTFTNTPTITQTFTNSPTYTFTPTYTLTLTLTNSATFTITTTYTATPTITTTDTITLTNTISATYTDTGTITQTSTQTPTYTNSATYTTTPTNTLTYTGTPTVTGTYTFTASPTNTNTDTTTQTSTISPTSTISATSTASPSITYSNTITRTSTASPTGTMTQTLTASPTITYTSTITQTSTISPTCTISATYTITPTITNTFTITQTSTISPTCTISATFTASPTITYTETITLTLTISPTETISATFTSTPTYTNTPTDTGTGTFTPTVTPVFTNTVTPTEYYRLPSEGQTYVFPQPASSVLNIVYNLNDQADVKIYIYNVAGMLVADIENSMAIQGTNKTTIDLSKFSPGIYYYVIKAVLYSGGKEDFSINKFMVAK